MWAPLERPAALSQLEEGIDQGTDRRREQVEYQGRSPVDSGVLLAR